MFEQRILDALTELDDDDDAIDVAQLFDFALIYARAGNLHARRLMYEQFAANAGDSNDFGATQLIDLDGIDGFRFVAARLGEAARLDSKFWDDAALMEYLKKCVPDITDADIAALGSIDASVQHYLDVVAQTMAQRAEIAQQRQDTGDLSYAQLKQIMEAQKPVRYSSFKRWGRSASAADCEAAARDMLKQNDSRMLAAYLAIFAQHRFPFGIQSLLPYIWHEDNLVARWTLDALSLFRDPALHDLGLELLRVNRHTGDALGLFNLNYHVGDEEVFISLLDAAQTNDEVHALGFGLIDVLTQNSVHREREILLMLYERQPCSLCRLKVVRRLAALRAIPDWMLHECQYDADEDTRAIVQRYQA